MHPPTASEHAGFAPSLAGSRTTQLLCARSGLVATVLAGPGMVVVGRFVPARSPATTAAEIASWYADNTLSIRLGLVLTLLSLTLLLPFRVDIHEGLSASAACSPSVSPPASSSAGSSSCCPYCSKR